MAGKAHHLPLHVDERQGEHETVHMRQGAGQEHVTDCWLKHSLIVNPCGVVLYMFGLYHRSVCINHTLIAQEQKTSEADDMTG